MNYEIRFQLRTEAYKCLCVVWNYKLLGPAESSMRNDVSRGGLEPSNPDAGRKSNEPNFLCPKQNSRVIRNDVPEFALTVPKNHML